MSRSRANILLSLKEIVERSDTRAGRTFDLTFQALIIFSLLAFAVDTLPGLPDQLSAFLSASEVAIVILFTIEYALRILVTDRKLKFVFSFFGIVDLLAILPFYLTTGLDLRSIRAIRLLRLFRIFKVMRYSEALARFHKAFLLAREELVLFLSASAIILYLASVGIKVLDSQLIQTATNIYD